MNTQREVIYAQRQKVLDGEDLRENMMSMLGDVVSGAVSDAFADNGGVANEDGLHRLAAAMEGIYFAKGTLSSRSNQLVGKSAAEVSDELNDYIGTHKQEPDYTYYIGYDTRRYYVTTDAGKLAGSSSATFSITCHDGGTLGKGSTTYKCGDCGKTVSAHTRQCSMRTSLGSDDSGVETAELQARLVRLQQQAAVLQAQVDQLNKENSELLRKMSGASGEDYEQYRTTYENNKKKIADLQSQLDNLDDEIVQTRQAITEAQEGEKEQTDDYNRIPQLMKAMKDAYHVSWTDNGSWSGNTFIRQGTVGNVKGTVTFKATVSIAAGANPMVLKKGIAKATEYTVEELKKISKPIESKTAIAQVASVSAGDEEIGTLLSDAFEKVGKDGVITIDESKTMKTELSVVEGMQFDRGYASPYMMTNREKFRAPQFRTLDERNQK